MCGFVGIVGQAGRNASQNELQPLLDKIKHRGPDDEGIYTHQNIAFGFRRLSILDLSQDAHQPMNATSAPVTIVFNGEIFNYIELRDELKKCGYEFRSNGDTEVLLNAYLHWGKDLLSHLNGMFAFLIHDRRDDSIFGARDRFGIKPLFMCQGHDHILFASEIKSIVASQNYQFKPDMRVAVRFLLEGKLDQQSETFFEGIRTIPAGSAFTVMADGKFDEWKWWNLDTTINPDINDPAGQFAELFEDSVKIRMRADVPLAVFLSGGLDSTSIICAVAREKQRLGNNEALNAYCYMSKDYDESIYIADTIEWTKANLLKMKENPELLWSDARQMLYYQDEPVHSFTPVIGYVLARMAARDGIKVVLNGQGADETLAGYGDFFPKLWHTLLMSGKITELWTQIGQYTKGHGGDQRALFLAVLRVAVQASFKNVSAYRSLSAQRRVTNLKTNAWFTDELKQHIHLEPSPYINQDLNASLYDSVVTQPLPLYLRAEDRNSMAHSIEFRLPFMDYRLINLLFSIDATEKIQGALNKTIQRKGMQGLIPESVQTRVDKMGFPTSLSTWMRNEFYEPAKAVLSSTSFGDRGLFDPDRILASLEEHRTGKADQAREIFALIQYEWWLQNHEQGEHRAN